MRIERRYLIPSSLARLIQREKGVFERVVEGHFPSNPDRSHLVRVDATACCLVLLPRTAEDTRAEQRTEIPLEQAEALLDVCAGTIAYDRSSLRLLPGAEVLLDRVITPKRVDLLTVVLDEQSSGEFDPPAWFGPEVTVDPAYERLSIAVSGPPQALDLTVSNAALEALLDDIEQEASTQQSNEHTQHADSLPASIVQPKGEPAALPSLRLDLDDSRAETRADTERRLREMFRRDEFLGVLVRPASPDKADPAPTSNRAKTFNSATRPPGPRWSDGDTRVLRPGLDITDEVVPIESSGRAERS